MHRIDGPTAAPGGLFTEGDPVGGVPATIVSDDWMNDVQENIIAVLTAAGIAPVKGTYTQLLDALLGRLVGPPQIFTASGTFTPTAGAKIFIVEVQGGGGGGAGCPATAAAQVSAGGGGASGSYGKGRFTIADIGASKAVTIGAGGAGGVGGADGSPGGATSFGALMSADGGLGGFTIAAAASGSAFIAYGGPPGNPATGGSIINTCGITGGFGYNALGARGGNGAGSPMANGGGGAKSSLISDAVGYAATSPGAGGGAPVNGASTAAKNGGAGLAGKVIVWELS